MNIIRVGIYNLKCHTGWPFGSFGQVFEPCALLIGFGRKALVSAGSPPVEASGVERWAGGPIVVVSDIESERCSVFGHFGRVSVLIGAVVSPHCVRVSGASFVRMHGPYACQ